MHISYITSYNALDIHNWSGLGFSIGKSLTEQGIELDYIGNLELRTNLFLKFKHILHKIGGKSFAYEREYYVARHFAEQAKSKLKAKTDIVFSPGSIPIALLETEKPKVFYTDTSFAGMLHFNPNYSKLCSESIRHGNNLEQKALESSKLIIYSSEWAAKTAITHYKVDPGKIKIVPFGANIDCQRNIDDIERIIQSRSSKTCDLLLIASDWNRKGGDMAIKVTRYLNDSGFKTRLHIIGVDKIPIRALPEYVIHHGFISKSTLEGRKQIDELIAKSHFLILPSIADCSPIALSEANSFGLPCITTDVGGIPSIIIDDLNGKMFSLKASAEEWCEYIMATFLDKKRYIELCLGSFNEYETRLNWNVAGKSIVKLIREI